MAQLQNMGSKSGQMSNKELFRRYFLFLCSAFVNAFGI